MRRTTVTVPPTPACMADMFPAEPIMADMSTQTPHLVVFCTSIAAQFYCFLL